MVFSGGAANALGSVNQTVFATETGASVTVSGSATAIVESGGYGSLVLSLANLVCRDL